MVVLDTNILIDHLRQQPTKDTLLKKAARREPKESFCVSVLSIQELYEGRSTKVRSVEQALLAVVAPLRILPYTFETARLAGEVARDLGRPISFVDAGIAATTILNDAALLTLNVKDFRDIPGLWFAHETVWQDKK